jgi:hypothetical protein
MRQVSPSPPDACSLLNFAREATMDHDKALRILKHLSDGNDPETGKPFPPDSAYQRPDVVRALFHAVRELESTPASEAKPASEGASVSSRSSSGKPGRPLPSNAGKPAEGGAVPASEARRCDPGAGSLPESAVSSRSSSGKPARPLPSNAGKPWSKEEDEGLVAGFEAGQTIAALAADHGRSRIAIEARLARFGKVPMPAGVRGGQTPHASDINPALYATQA